MTCWVLTLKTSLPYVGIHHANLHTECRVFDRFSKARDALRAWLKPLVSTRNAMFDGQGKMIRFEQYIQNSKHEDTAEEYWEFMDNGWLTKGRMQALSDALAAALVGQDVDLPLEDGDYVDTFLCLTVKSHHVNLNGLDADGGSAYAPIIRTNMFNMAQEGDYYLSLKDQFGQSDSAAELYIELKHAEME